MLLQAHRCNLNTYAKNKPHHQASKTLKPHTPCPLLFSAHLLASLAFAAAALSNDIDDARPEPIVLVLLPTTLDFKLADRTLLATINRSEVAESMREDWVR